MKDELQEALTQCLASGDTAHIDTAERLLKKTEAQVDPTDTMTWGWFVVAVNNNRPDVAQLLIQKGLLVSAINNETEMKTPLHVAADAGDDKTVAYLVKNGADVNAEAAKKKTALHFSANEGHLNVVQILADLGATVEAKDSKGRTAADIAKHRGHLQITRLLNPSHDPEQIPGGLFDAAPAADLSTTPPLTEEKKHRK
ncbi:MAG TPA: ankyrin repeat domain-containing protein [Gammaproteobacteria bacterium]|nr:ankyrin repeat domain-containing protein [Gammaproteobacteria bacterium]